MKRIGSKRVLVVFVVSFIVMCICNSLLVSHIVSFEYYGFGVDSSGRLYVGWGNKIEVYENGERVHVITRGTNKGHFFFTIQDDTILLSFDSDVIIMDLEGKDILKRWIEPDEKTRKMLKQIKYEFRTPDGELYTASNDFLRVTISHDGEAIFKTPLLDRMVSYSAFISFPILIISGLILKKQQKNNE